MSEYLPLLLAAIAAIIILRIIARKAKVPYSWKFLVVVFLTLLVVSFPISMFMRAGLPFIVGIIGSIIVIGLIYYYRKKIFTKKVTAWLRK